MLNDTFKISNGVEIPIMGLGTWQSDDTTAKMAVLAALSHGYRLVDTAAAYGNELGVGRGVKESGLKREEIFITSKLRNADHGYKNTVRAFELTLKKLDTDYLDLYLMHWPNPVQYRTHWQEAMAGTWKAMEEFYKQGRIRVIGISNFMEHHIVELEKTAEIKPMVNQLKLCPGVTQPEIVDYCKKNGIVVEAYSPFGQGAIFSSPEMKALSAKYNKSIGQLCLRWCLQLGFVSLPKSANPMRIKDNANIFDFEISKEDMDIISNLEGYCGDAPDPDNILF